jgi:SAM-dependent methyltransferase
MTGVFGDVAQLYDDVRPSYPAGIGDAIEAYAGKIENAVELGAGTGKATRIFAPLAKHLTAIEPDPRMAAILKATLSATVKAKSGESVRVVEATFEEWTPSAENDLVACAMAWHWMDPETRNQRVRDALRPGGTFAVISLEHGHHVPAQAKAIDAFLNGLDPAPPSATGQRNRDDLIGSGLWSDIREHDWHELLELPKERFLALHRTFSTYQKKSPQMRQRMMDGLGTLLDDFGGSIVMDLHTTLVLARRTATR